MYQETQVCLCQGHRWHFSPGTQDVTTCCYQVPGQDHWWITGSFWGEFHDWAGCPTFQSWWPVALPSANTPYHNTSAAVSFGCLCVVLSDCQVFCRLGAAIYHWISSFTWGCHCSSSGPIWHWTLQISCTSSWGIGPWPQEMFQPHLLAICLLCSSEVRCPSAVSLSLDSHAVAPWKVLVDWGRDLPCWYRYLWPPRRGSMVSDGHGCS